VGPLSDVTRLVAVRGPHLTSTVFHDQLKHSHAPCVGLLPPFDSTGPYSTREFETGLGQAAFARALVRGRVRNAHPLGDDKWAGSPDLARELDP